MPKSPVLLMHVSVHACCDLSHVPEQVQSFESTLPMHIFVDPNQKPSQESATRDAVTVGGVASSCADELQSHFLGQQKPPDKTFGKRKRGPILGPKPGTQSDPIQIDVTGDEDSEHVDKAARRDDEESSEMGMDEVAAPALPESSEMEMPMAAAPAPPESSEMGMPMAAAPAADDSAEDGLQSRSEIATSAGNEPCAPLSETQPDPTVPVCGHVTEELSSCSEAQSNHQADKAPSGSRSALETLEPPGDPTQIDGLEFDPIAADRGAEDPVPQTTPASARATPSRSDGRSTDHCAAHVEQDDAYPDASNAPAAVQTPLPEVAPKRQVSGPSGADHATSRGKSKVLDLLGFSRTPVDTLQIYPSDKGEVEFLSFPGGVYVCASKTKSDSRINNVRDVCAHLLHHAQKFEDVPLEKQEWVAVSAGTYLLGPIELLPLQKGSAVRRGACVDGKRKLQVDSEYRTTQQKAMSPTLFVGVVDYVGGTFVKPTYTICYWTATSTNGKDMNSIRVIDLPRKLARKYLTPLKDASHAAACMSLTRSFNVASPFCDPEYSWVQDKQKRLDVVLFMCRFVSEMTLEQRNLSMSLLWGTHPSLHTHEDFQICTDEFFASESEEEEDDLLEDEENEEGEERTGSWKHSDVKVSLIQQWVDSIVVRCGMRR